MSGPHLIIAVGGTGQLVLHYYAQLFLIGAVRESFHAIVMDPDALLPSLKILSDQFQKATLGWEGQAPPPPNIEYWRIQFTGAGNVRQALTGRSQRAFHSVSAFFDSITLEQQVMQGLFARPALSAVMAPNWDRLPTDYSQFDRVLVVGSTTGGTGGGLVAPLLAQLADRIVREPAHQPGLCALLFGEYFLPDVGVNQARNMPDADLRFPSNKLMVATTFTQLAPAQLRYFTYIEPREKIRRDPAAESKAEHLPWPPGPQHPYWLGVTSAYRLLREVVMPANPEVLQRELEPDASRLDLAAAETRRIDRASVAHAIVTRNVIQLLASESFVSRVWGDRMPAMIAAAYQNARQNPALRLGSVAEFAAKVGSQFSAYWSQVEKVFPNTPPARVSPSKVSETWWGTFPKQLDTNVTDSEETIVKVTAANLLFRVLRGGRA